MALLVCFMGGGGSCAYMCAQKSHLLPRTPPYYFASLTRSSSTPPLPLLVPSPPPSSKKGGGRSDSHVAHARRGVSSRTRRLDNRGKKGILTTNPPNEDQEGEGKEKEVLGEEGISSSSLEGGVSNLPPMPVLPGEEPNFWEGSQWDAFGFVVQYLWAFGIGFALIACGIAVATYNEGATDFKQTPAYKESIQSGELLEEPEGSSSDVFEANPTEEAPSLE